MKNLLTIIACLSLLQGCITDTTSGPGHEQSTDRSNRDAPPTEPPVNMDSPVDPPVDDPNPPVDDPTPPVAEPDPPITEPVPPGGGPVVPGNDIDPMAPGPVSAPFIRLAIDTEATANLRQLEDGRLFIETSQIMVLEAVIAIAPTVVTDEGRACRTNLKTVEETRDGTVIRLSVEATLSDCMAAGDVIETTQDHTRRLEFSGLEPGTYAVIAPGVESGSRIELRFNVVADGELPMS